MGTSEARGSLPSGAPNYPRATALFLIFTSSTYLCAALYHPYYFWDVTLGHWVTAHHTLPTRNIWTWMGLHTPWVSDSWLFSVLVSALEPWGESVVAFTMMALTFLTLSAFAWLFISQSRSVFLGSSLALVVGIPVFWGGVVRSEHLGLAIGSLMLVITYFVVRGQGDVPWWKRTVLFLLSALLVNMSALFLLFIPFCAALIFTATMPAHRKRGYLLALFLALFCSPYGGFQIGTLLHQGIRFLGSNATGIFAPSIYYFPFAFLLVLLTFVAILWHETPAALSKSEILFFLGTTIAGFSSAFFVPLGTFFSGFVAAQLWGRNTSQRHSNIVEAVNRLEQLCATLPRVGVIWIALCLSIVNVYQLSKAPLDTSSLPVRAVDFILDQKLDGSLAHEPILGSYLVYRFSDGKGLPIRIAAADDRGMSLSNEFITVYRAFREGGRFWEQFLREYAPSLVLCRSVDPVYSLLRRDAAWKVVFGDLSDVDKQGLSANGTWVVFQKVSER